jgi:N-acetylglucosaminyldiphosphoundecaprenol N-acetyl-beta-D-mannosaminyltransferase
MVSMATQALVSHELFAAVLGPSVTRPEVARQRERLELGGVLIDRVDVGGAMERLREFLVSGKTHQVVTVNLDFLSIAQRNPEFRATINQADLAVADGMPVVWLSQLRGEPLPERVAGVELVGECCQMAAQKGYDVFLLGAGPGIAQAAAARLEVLYPGLQVVGTYTPPLGPLSADEDARIVELIRAASPTFLFVALGAPRQDLWIRQHLEELQVPVAMGVGCVLDLLAGAVERAPLWMRKWGLEWVFRLLQEPQRLWRRYFLNDLPTLGRLVLSPGPSAAPGA